MRIANKISIMFVITSMVASLAVLGVIYVRTAGIIKTAVVDALTIAAQSRAEHLITYMHASTESTTQLSKSVVIKKLLAETPGSRDYSRRLNDVQVRLADTLYARECIFAIDILNRNGDLVASTFLDKIEGCMPCSPELFSFLKDNFKNRESDVFIQDVFWCLIKGKRAWGVFAPVEDDKDRFNGIVYVRFNMDSIDKIVSASIGSWTSGEAYLINRDGFMITPSRQIEDTFLKVKVKENIKHSCFAFGDSGARALPGIYKNYRDQGVVGVFAGIPDVHWCLLSEVKTREAWAILAEIKILFVAIFIIFCLAAWLISGLITKWFLHPIQELRTGTEIIGKGNLNYKLSIERKDEFGTLALAINEMTEDLKTTTTSRDYVNSIIESMSYSLIVASPQDCRIQTVNQATLDLLGYSKKELIGKELSSIFAESADFVCPKGDIKAMVSHGRLRKYESWFRTKKGLYVPVLFSSTLLRELGSKEGEASGILCVAEDISEQKKTREALRESEGRLSQIVQGVAIPLFVINNRGQVIYWNKACKKLTDLPAEKIIGTTDQWKALYLEKRPTLADLLLSPDPEKEIKEKFSDKLWRKSGLIEGAYEIEGFFPEVGKNGKWLHGSASPIKDSKGKIIAVIETLEDISERKKFEGALKDSKQRLSEIVDGAAIPMLVIDKDHRVTHWNRTCERLTGFSADEMIGTRKHWIPFYTSPRPLLADLILDNIGEDIIRNFYQGGEVKRTNLMERSYEVESFFPVLGEKGTWLRFTAAPVRNSQGEMIAAIETLEDITERKKLYQMKDEFVSTVSHELRTPLTTIREAVSQMYDGILGDTTEEQKEVLSIGLSDIDRLTRIINNLLDISKIEAGEIELHREKVDLVALLKDVVTLFSPQVKVKGLALETDLPEEKVMLYLDKDKIIQVFNNLLGNALKFTSKGYIEISLRDHVNTVECVIRDTGIGIAEEFMPQLFSKFYQIGRGPGPGEKGTGLGLSIAKGIIELHSGGIGVESKLNQGSKFTVFLPKFTSRELFVEHVTKGIGEALKESMLLSVVTVKLRNLTELTSMLPIKKFEEIYAGLDGEVRNSLHRHADKYVREKNVLYVMFLSEEKEDCDILADRLLKKIEKYLSRKLHRYIKPRICRGIAVFPDDGATAGEVVAIAEDQCREGE